MTYLSLLESQKKEREKFEQEEHQLKKAITECNSLFSLHDGDFLIKLQEFINNYKKENSK